MPIHYLILGTALLLLASVLASKASERLGVPALLMFLLVGMLAGSEGPGGIHFDDPHLVRLLGTFALAYILFAGGLDTEWKSVRPVFRSGVILATAGVLLTAVLVGLFAVWVLGFTWLEGLLLGSVMSSTDAAAIFAALRSRHVSLKGQLKPLLELESASNDPMAMIQRNGEYLVPNGGTEFQPGDVVLVLGEKGVLETTRQLLTVRRQSA
ncbi:MAG TPA: cation:proton antiporter [Sedimentisphaerales bacterium]|nr:cation:proton antiporter [Sedimentisphaerales bacterium]HNU27633.1 cation:proton antiporter [Sedimentisphaerales bacterium]